MKLEKILTKKYKGKPYYSYRIIIPLELVSELGWKEDIELKPKIEGRKLVIEPYK